MKTLQTSNARRICFLATSCVAIAVVTALSRFQCRHHSEYSNLQMLNANFGCTPIVGNTHIPSSILSSKCLHLISATQQAIAAARGVPMTFITAPSGTPGQASENRTRPAFWGSNIWRYKMKVKQLPLENQWVFRFSD